jgi:hypothetical protein
MIMRQHRHQRSRIHVGRSEMGAFYWTVPAPDIVNPGRQEQDWVSVLISWEFLPARELWGLAMEWSAAISRAPSPHRAPPNASNAMAAIA